MKAFSWFVGVAASLSLFVSTISKTPSSPLLFEAAPSKVIKVRVLHFNDVHARIEPADKNQSPCDRSKQLTDKSYECFGGMAKLVAKAKEFREGGRNLLDTVTIVLDAGDEFMGTIWNTHFKGVAIAPLQNLITPDAFVLGNHEFDFESKVLADFIANTNVEILSCNVDISKAKEFDGVKGRFRKYKIVESPDGKTKIGLVGYTTPETAFLSSPGQVTFVDEMVALPECIEAAKTNGAEAVVLVGHSGYIKDQEIAANEWMKDVILIVGAHSHTLLGDKDSLGDDEEPQGPYPTLVTNSHFKNQIPVVQAFWASKYSGAVDYVEFNTGSNQIAFKGNPVILSDQPSSIHYFKDDDEAAKVIQSLAPQLDAFRKEILGSTKCQLDGKEDARVKETSLGNVVTNAMLDALKNKGARAAIFNGGSLRASVGIGNITRESVLTVLPFGNELVLVNVTGSQLYLLMEEGVSQWKPKSGGDLKGRFPQIAGMSMKFDSSKKPMERVSEIKLDGLPIPKTSNEAITVATNSYLVKGGDGYVTFLKSIPIDMQVGVIADFVMRYIQQKPVNVKCEGRITNTASGLAAEDKCSNICKEVESTVLTPTPRQKQKSSSNGRRLEWRMYWFSVMKRMEIIYLIWMYLV